MDRRKEIINAFITLTENVANSKTNVLVLDTEDMTFYRGEIHTIKIIGDEQGIFSSEIARKFGVTRAVIHKTLLKLEDRGLIEKKADPEDKKKFKLYLTARGKEAYALHEAYHQQYDKALFDYIQGLTDTQLEGIQGFLEHASHLIQNHA